MNKTLDMNILRLILIKTLISIVNSIDLQLNFFY